MKVGVAVAATRCFTVFALCVVAACDDNATSVSPTRGVNSEILRELLPPPPSVLPVSLDSVTFTSPKSLVIGGVPATYSASITNRQRDGFNLLALESFVTQGAVRRAAGAQLLQCGASLGILPPLFTCVRSGQTLSAANSGAGIGTLLPGAAVVVVELVRTHLGVRTVIDAKSVPITLTAPTGGTVANVTVSPANATLTRGATMTLTATAWNASGQPVAATFTWTSSSPAIASVNGAGVVTAVALGGPVTITASASGRSATASITVATSTPGTITVNGAQQFQTMTGWEALQEIGQAECDPRAYLAYRNQVLDRAVNEIGINRIRVGLRSGYENPTDYFLQFRAGRLTFNEWKTHWFQILNDNSNPFVTNTLGYNWGYLDYVIEQIILPLRQRLQAQGENLWFNLSYTGATLGTVHANNTDEYTEFVLAAFQHIRQKYSITPNSLELANEPNFAHWTPQQLAKDLLAVKIRLNQAGFFPEFVGPTGSGIVASTQYFDQMIAVPGVAQALNEISYHRFGVVLPSDLQGLARRASQYRMRTAMLEHGGSGHDHLYEDLTIANVSAWQQFGLAFCTDVDRGSMYFYVSGATVGQNSPVVNTGRLTKMLRQYFRYVRLGAVRVGAVTKDARFAPVAFRNTNGKYVVVVKAANAGSFSVAGLPAGTYGIDYTTAVDYMKPLPNVVITGTQAVTAAIPAAGVLTIFRR